MVRIASFFLSLSVSLSLVAQVAPAPLSNASLQAQLKSAVMARWDALEKGDFQVYGAFLDDGFLMIDDDGSALTKSNLINEVRHNQQKGNREHNSEPAEIRVWGAGDTAVLSYKTTNTALFAGQQIVTDQRILENFVLRNKKWLLVSRAEVPIPNSSRQPAQVNPAAFRDYVGQYETAPNSVVKVWREGDRLYEEWPGEQKTSDFPLTDSVFYQHLQPGLLNFVRDETGAVTGFQLWIGDSTITGRKIR
jgi:hypothetical protein